MHNHFRSCHRMFQTLESNTSRAVSEYIIFGFQDLAHAFTESLSSPEVKLWMASFDQTQHLPWCPIFNRNRKKCFFKPHLSLIAQAFGDLYNMTTYSWVLACRCKAGASESAATSAGLFLVDIEPAAGLFFVLNSCGRKEGWDIKPLFF